MGAVSIAREKRKQKRFSCKGEAFVALISTEEPIRVGRIDDISLGGVSFQYISTDKARTGTYIIEIFGKTKEVTRLQRLGSRIVYDREIPEKSCGPLVTRHCGVKFDTITSARRAELKDFIKLFAHNGRELSVELDGTKFKHSQLLSVLA